MTLLPENYAVSVRLTATAQSYADAKLVAKAVEAAGLGGAASVGDLVTLSTGGQKRDFTIVTRRWIVEESSTVLELTLDHPVRRGA